MEYTYEYIPQIDKEVEFFGEVKMVDEGIGQYEYWGQRCYDENIVPVCEEVLWDKRLFTEEENKIIDTWLDEERERVGAILEQNYEADEY
jgi:hypothetical protein